MCCPRSSSACERDEGFNFEGPRQAVAVHDRAREGRVQGQLSLIDIAGTSVSMFLSTWRLNVEVARKAVARVCSLYYPEMMACCCELCALWAGAGPPEGVHAGERWGPMARRSVLPSCAHFWRNARRLGLAARLSSAPRHQPACAAASEETSGGWPLASPSSVTASLQPIPRTTSGRPLRDWSSNS